MRLRLNQVNVTYVILTGRDAVSHTDYVTENVRPETTHDEQMLKLHAEAFNAQVRVAQAKKNVAWYEKESAFYQERYLPEAKERLARAIAAFDAAIRALDAHEDGYKGWKRYFLVVSSAGLIHASQHCHTCNKGRSATQFALLPSMSGLNDVEALVDAVGAALCSVCFPEAPTSWTDQVRLPTTLTLILFEQGEEAFRTALAAYKTKQAAKAKVECPGSGTFAPPSDRPRYGRSRYAKCSHCDQVQSVTSNGKFRKHSAK